MKYKRLLSYLPIAIFTLVVGTSLLSFFSPNLLPSSNSSAEPGISVDQYIDRLANGKTDWQRYNAAAALGELKAKKAIPFLITALDDKNDAVRMNSVKALEELAAVQAKVKMEQLLNDPSADVRANAASALEAFKAEESRKSASTSLDVLILFFPALIIAIALFYILKFGAQHPVPIKFRYFAIIGWIVGVVLAWFAVRPYWITETEKAVGFPFKAAIFQASSGGWVDYIGPLTMTILALDIVYAAFAPQAFIAVFLLWHSRTNKSNF